MLAERRTDICPTEICKAAAISRTTFYAHYNHHDVIKQYEERLMAKFLREIPAAMVDREAIFVWLLRFVRDEREYFVATMPNANYWLLNAIFLELQEVLGYAESDEMSYKIYALQQIALISCWVQYDDFAFEKIRPYARRMASLPIVKTG